MKIEMLKLFIALIITIILSPVLQAEITLSQSISETKIAFEDSVQFQIVVEWQGSQSAYLFHKPLSPYIDRMKIGKFSSSISSIIKDGLEVTQKKYNYTLLPTSAGLGIVDSLSIAYLKRNDTIPNFLITEPIEVLIANPVTKISKKDNANFWLIIASLFVIIIGVISYLQIKKKSKLSEIQLSSKEQFLLELTNIKKQSASDMKIFQTELFSAIAKYLVTEYSVDVSQVQTDSLIDTLSQKGMSVAKAEQITIWLQKAELDKFAPTKQSPGAVVRLESEIRIFFEKI